MLRGYSPLSQLNRASRHPLPGRAGRGGVRGGCRGRGLRCGALDRTFTAPVPGGVELVGDWRHKYAKASRTPHLRPHPLPSRQRPPAGGPRAPIRFRTPGGECRTGVGTAPALPAHRRPPAGGLRSWPGPRPPGGERRTGVGTAPVLPAHPRPPAGGAQTQSGAPGGGYALVPRRQPRPGRSGPGRPRIVRWQSLPAARLERGSPEADPVSLMPAPRRRERSPTRPEEAGPSGTGHADTDERQGEEPHPGRSRSEPLPPAHGRRRDGERASGHAQRPTSGRERSLTRAIRIRAGAADPPRRGHRQASGRRAAADTPAVRKQAGAWGHRLVAADETGGGGVAGVVSWTLTCICGANPRPTQRSRPMAP